MVHHECYGIGNEAAPVAFIAGPDSANQLSLGITQKAERKGLQRDVRTVLLTIFGCTLPEFSPLSSRLDAHSEDLDLFWNVSFGFIDKGRHLGPAPGSPPTAIKENDGRGRLTKNRRKLHGLAVDVTRSCRGKFFANLQSRHISRFQPRSLSASNIFSAVIGSDLILTPTASSIALATAAATGMLDVSPIAMLL